MLKIFSFALCILAVCGNRSFAQDDFSRLSDKMKYHIIGDARQKKKDEDNISLVCKDWLRISNDLSDYLCPKSHLRDDNLADLFKRFNKLGTLELERFDSFTDKAFENCESIFNITCLSLGSHQKITGEILSKFRNITRLDIERNPHVSDSVLQNLTSLRELLTSKSKKSFPVSINSLNHLTRLEILEVTENVTLSDGMFAHLTRLKELRFKGRICGEDGQELGLEHLKSLEVLNCEALIFSDDLISQMTGLKELHLGVTQISDPVMKNLTNLETLYLDYNQTLTIDCLKLLPNLTKLDLEDSAISSWQVYEFLESSSREIDLSYIRGY